MKTVEVIKTVNLTVELGSRVIITEEQYKAAKDYLAPIVETKKGNVSKK